MTRAPPLHRRRTANQQTGERRGHCHSQPGGLGAFDKRPGVHGHAGRNRKAEVLDLPHEPHARGQLEEERTRKEPLGVVRCVLRTTAELVFQQKTLSLRETALACEAALLRLHDSNNQRASKWLTRVTQSCRRSGVLLKSEPKSQS